MLKDRVEASNFNLKEKLWEIEAQIFADKCLLTELKWEDVELRSVENRIRSERKRTHRRQPQDLPNHRYPTRYLNAVNNDRSPKTRWEMGRINDWIRKVEE